MADKIFQRTDDSGKVTIAVFRRQASAPAAHFHDFQVDVDPDMVAIGGGATGVDAPQGALLTASYPDSNRSAWLVSSKDHLVPEPHRLVGFSIGMRIAGVSRRDLLRQHLQFTQVTSGGAQHPTASGGPSEGFALISGGFRVNWRPGAGNLATASFPEFDEQWTARSKDHIEPAPCTIDVFSVGLRAHIPGAGRVERRASSSIGGPAAHPSATATLHGAFALTGIGAEARWGEPGSLLWQIEPFNQGVTASAKDHVKPSPAMIKAWAIGIRMT
ncbi:hypothetical protein [Streptomyces griseocarneus]|uniref:hypothetical protein n=1 Tax=Streptomyces griseocarneus TaxID=51201 RepID=UPI00167E095C|nr:hypothetical protein [Streptomyces griseocarneus]MBZ6476500.1 hypothetical protein [Streptomyces griseocarneus]GHG78577.1 hypothetical protein GCM10018779_58430 [Streptomyces griseocarneus]